MHNLFYRTLQTFWMRTAPCVSAAHCGLPLGNFAAVKNSMFFLLALLTFSATAFEIPPQHRIVSGAAVRGILECRFDDVIRATDSAYNAGGRNVMAAVMHLAALGMRDIDFDSMIDTVAFMRSFERAREAVHTYERAHGTDSYTMTLHGFVLGMNASFHLKNKSYFAAAGTGLDAIKVMKEARESDPQNTEVNFFLGLYDYARAELRKKLWMVMFWYPGDKASGIRLLEEGSRSAALTGTAAALALADIYLKEKQPLRAREIIHSLRREIPTSRFLLWAEVKHLEDQKMFRQAAVAYGRLADSYDRNQPHGAYNAIVTRSRQAQMHQKADETELAVKACRKLLEQRDKGGKRASGIIRDTEKLLERLEK